MDDEEWVERMSKEEWKQVLHNMDDNEAFILCLLFMIQNSYRGGSIGKTVAHASAFLGMWDEMGKDGRAQMNGKISELAKRLGYPGRAKDIVNRRDQEEADLSRDRNEEDLPEPHPGMAKA